MAFTPEQAAAIVARFPNTVEAEGATLFDLDSGAEYRPASVRDALGWIMAGEADNDGTNTAKTRLTQWWHHRPQLHGQHRRQ